ncbi:MAG: hypothetical protein PHZ21_01525 [Candidatus Bipolaricaulis sp.]|nr:hypothetical protein [Candidatus Bipolaricaulis sp.]MDY0392440.1 hypothetical protein [Candidatus Bipolaricaulis sp.]
MPPLPHGELLKLEDANEEGAMGSVPTSVSVGLELGGVAAFLFVFANLYAFLHLLQKLFFPKTEVQWLKAMGRRWHYVHYFGNITAIVLALAHGILLASYASVWHWVVVALLVWMMVTGFTMRFTKAPAQAKRTLRNLHTRWYISVAVLLAVLIVAHLVSLPGFPYSVG